MNAQNVLVGMLGVQVLLTAVTWWPRGDGPESRPVLPFDADAITKVTIQSATTDNKGDGLVLERKDDSWVLASEYGYPAVDEKVDEVIEKLESLKIKAPIARNATSHEQLNVADDNATRRLTVEAGGESVSFVLGVAGNSRSHLRLKGESEVFLVPGVGAWSIRDTPASYLERKLLDVSAGSLESYALINPAGGVELVRGPDNQWTSPGLPEGQTVDPAKLDALFKNTLSLNLTSPADPTIDPFAADDGALLRWTSTLDGVPVSNALALVETEAGAVVRVEDQALPVIMGGLTQKQALMETTLDALLKSAEPQVPEIDIDE